MRTTATNGVQRGCFHPQTIAVAAQVSLVHVYGRSGHRRSRLERLFFVCGSDRNVTVVPRCEPCVTRPGGGGGGAPRSGGGRGVNMGRNMKTKHNSTPRGGHRGRLRGKFVHRDVFGVNICLQRPVTAEPWVPPLINHQSHLIPDATAYFLRSGGAKPFSP